MIYDDRDDVDIRFLGNHNPTVGSTQGIIEQFYILNSTGSNTDTYAASFKSKTSRSRKREVHILPFVTSDRARHSVVASHRDL